MTPANEHHAQIGQVKIGRHGDYLHALLGLLHRPWFFCIRMKGCTGSLTASFQSLPIQPIRSAHGMSIKRSTLLFVSWRLAQSSVDG